MSSDIASGHSERADQVVLTTSGAVDFPAGALAALRVSTAKVRG